jgi:aryl sulfotransferase
MTSTTPERLHTYQTFVYDSTRWDGFKPRAGDVIVCTPPKCGTTWTQMLCAMLVHDTPVLPRPLTEITRWLDRHTLPIEDMLADLEAQEGPRIIKTHTPLDGLPYFPEARYVYCGRDPRDAYLSFGDHMDNLSPASLADFARRAGADIFAGRPKDPNVMFPMWATQGAFPWMYDGAPGQSVLSFTETFWRFRHLPNLLMIHYRDMTEHLDGEMRRLAAFLGVKVDEARWPEFLAAGSFSNMKARADETAPNADKGEWRSNADFFRKARLDAWREALTPENQALYEEVNRERVDPAMKLWIERGRGAAGDPRLI